MFESYEDRLNRISLTKFRAHTRTKNGRNRPGAVFELKVAQHLVNLGHTLMRQRASGRLILPTSLTKADKKFYIQNTFATVDSETVDDMPLAVINWDYPNPKGGYNMSDFGLVHGGELVARVECKSQKVSGSVSDKLYAHGYFDLTGCYGEEPVIFVMDGDFWTVDRIDEIQAMFNEHNGDRFHVLRLEDLTEHYLADNILNNVFAF
jgi:hypothetical protein